MGLREPVELWVCDGLDELLGVAVALEVSVCDEVPDKVRVSEAVCVCEELDVGLGVADCDIVCVIVNDGLCVGEGVPEPE